MALCRCTATWDASPRRCASHEEKRQRAAERVHARAATAEEILGVAPTWEQTAAAFCQAFQETLDDLRLAPGELNDFEKETAERLVREKYNHPEWTSKV